MSDFPRAFGLFPIFGDFEYVDFTQSIEGAEITATEYGKNRIKVVELIPLPEHEAIVAAAVKAERERLMKMVTPLTVLQDVIREVPS